MTGIEVFVLVECIAIPLWIYLTLNP